jgi:hypothetical protein
VHNLTNVCDSLITKNSKLLDEIDCLVVSRYDVPHEYSVKLDKLLSFQKSHGDRCGLGFENEAYTSKNPLNSQGKIVFVPLLLLRNRVIALVLEG